MFGWLSGASKHAPDGDEAAERAAARQRAEAAVRLALRAAPRVGLVCFLTAPEILRYADTSLSVFAGQPGGGGASGEAEGSDAGAHARALFEYAASGPAPPDAPVRYGVVVAFPTRDTVGPIAVNMPDVVYDAQSKRYMLVDDADAVAALLGATEAAFRAGRLSSVLGTLVQRADKHVAAHGADALFPVMEMAPGECTREEGREPLLHGAAATVADVCMRIGWTLKIVPRAALGGTTEWSLVARVAAGAPVQARARMAEGGAER